MTTFCAICTDDHCTDLAVITLDGRTYAACKACRDEHPRSGRYDFNGGAADPRGNAQGTTNKQHRKGVGHR